MARARVRIVLTGPPGCGKTTAVMKVVGALDQKLRMVGFYTQEVREAGRRKGFRWHRLDGRAGMLAHVDIKGPYRVSKYGVDVESFDREAVSVLNPDATEVDLFVIDEIGKIECFSDKFVDAVRRLLDSGRSILATVAQKGSGLIREAKSHPGIKLLHLTPANRDEVTQEIIDKLTAVKP